MRIADVVFEVAGWLSIGQWLRALTGGSGWLAAQVLELYVAGWVVAETLFYVLAPDVSATVLVTLASYRFAEILVVFINATLFDAARWERRKRRPYMVQSGERTLVLYVLLFLEIVLLFGVGYFAFKQHFEGLETHLDALAQSLGVITTSGTEFRAEAEWRFLPLGQVLCGFLVGVIVLARVVAILRPIGALDRRS